MIGWVSCREGIRIIFVCSCHAVIITLLIVGKWDEVKCGRSDAVGEHQKEELMVLYRRRERFV